MPSFDTDAERVDAGLNSIAVDNMLCCSFVADVSRPTELKTPVRPESSEMIEESSSSSSSSSKSSN